jgi:hypothetical protein
MINLETKYFLTQNNKQNGRRNAGTAKNSAGQGAAVAGWRSAESKSNN